MKNIQTGYFLTHCFCMMLPLKWRFMKILISLILSLLCANAVAFVTQIERFEKNSSLSEKKVLSLVHDTFLYQLWQEEGGVSCGGDFRALEVVLENENEIVIKGDATKGLEGCLEVQEVSLEIVIDKKTKRAIHSSMNAL